MTAPKHNTYRRLADEDRRSSRLVVLVTPGEKARLVRECRPGKLAEHVRAKLGLAP